MFSLKVNFTNVISSTKFWLEQLAENDQMNLIIMMVGFVIITTIIVFFYFDSLF